MKRVKNGPVGCPRIDSVILCKSLNINTLAKSRVLIRGANLSISASPDVAMGYGRKRGKWVLVVQCGLGHPRGFFDEWGETWKP